jgi:hypothetical protein
MAVPQFFHAYAIKDQWINFSLYFTNFMYKTKNKSFRNKVCKFITNKYRLQGNDNPIGGKQKNNIWLAHGDYTKTAFIEVNKNDFIKFYDYKNPNLQSPFNDVEQLGFRLEKTEFQGNYMRAENHDSNSATNRTNQERDPLDSNKWNDGKSHYFLKGTNDNDIFKYLVESNII